MPSESRVLYALVDPISPPPKPKAGAEIVSLDKFRKK